MTETVAIAAIRIDGGTQSRASLYQNVVDDYASAIEEGAAFPPVVVFHDGSVHWLADGFHRHAACAKLGLVDIDAIVRQGTRRDAILYSVGANETHGLRRTNEDKRRAVLTLLSDSEWSAWADREIARRCCVGADMVGRLRSADTVAERQNGERTFVHPKTGNPTTMDTSRIGARPFDPHQEREHVEAYEKIRAANGTQPGKENLRAAVGTDSASAAERGNNLYETPAEAMHTLLALETFSPTVKEPACGRGAISKLLEAAGYEVELSDLVDYGTVTQHGELQRIEDFLHSAPATLASQPAADGGGSFLVGPDIATNPPYGTVLNAFVAHALRVHRPRKMALLLNLNFLCGFDDPDRNYAMDENKPARVHIFTRRLPMMHRDGWDGNEATSRMNTAWFVWEMNDDGDYAGPAVVNRVDWKDYQPAKAA